MCTRYLHEGSWIINRLNKSARVPHKTPELSWLYIIGKKKSPPNNPSIIKGKGTSANFVFLVIIIIIMLFYKGNLVSTQKGPLRKLSIWLLISNFHVYISKQYKKWFDVFQYKSLRPVCCLLAYNFNGCHCYVVVVVHQSDIIHNSNVSQISCLSKLSMSIIINFFKVFWNKVKCNKVGSPSSSWLTTTFAQIFVVHLFALAEWLQRSQCTINPLSTCKIFRH